MGAFGLFGTNSANHTNQKETEQSSSAIEHPVEEKATATRPDAAVFSYSIIPSYDKAQTAEINGNTPYFSDDEIQYAKDNPGFQYDGSTDTLKRCTVACASIGKEALSTDDDANEEVTTVEPTGWDQAAYESAGNEYPFTRIRLIGSQLTGSESNATNLFTGTQAMQNDGMTKCEERVASYVESTGNHVLYRATPVFRNNDLVARGVLLEAYSVEDDGAGLKFCIWVYNVQSGVDIDYTKGGIKEDTPAEKTQPTTSESEKPAEKAPETTETTPKKTEQEHTYILNTSTGKFHVPGCSQIKKMKEANKSEVTATRSEMLDKGYSPCGRCNP